MIGSLRYLVAAVVSWARRLLRVQRPAELSPEHKKILDALMRLRGVDQRQAAIIEHFWIHGMTDDEIAAKLSVSARTVKRDKLFAKAWLWREIHGENQGAT